MLRVICIHTYRESDVQFISVSDRDRVANARDMVDDSITSIVDAMYVVNELVVSEHTFVGFCMSGKLPQRHMLVLLGFQSFELLTFAVERLPHMSPGKNWYTSLLEFLYERESYIRDPLVVGEEDSQHIVTAKVVKEGTCLTWPITITAAKDANRIDFYGNFGPLKKRHQAKNLACF